MAESKVGAIVRYCGHRAYFIADIIKVGTANAVRASGPVTMEKIARDREGYDNATHQIVDFPIAGLWSPRTGVFVVPEDQVWEL